MRGARVGLKAGARLLASAGEGGGQLGRGAGAGSGGEGDGLRAGEGKWPCAGLSGCLGWARVRELGRCWSEGRRSRARPPEEKKLGCPGLGFGLGFFSFLFLSPFLFQTKRPMHQHECNNKI